MSSLDHQSINSPSRDLPTPDAETSFFRSWALRTRNSAYSSSSDISPGTRTPVASPISPRTLAPRPQRREVPTRSSESHVYHVESGPYRRDVTGQQTASSQLAPGSAAHERTTTRSRGSGDALAPRSSSNASSIARRALSLVKGSAYARRPSANQDTKPDKPVKNGLSWKRELSGHWLEIRIGKKEESNRTPPGTQHSTSHVHYSPTLPSHTATRTRGVSGHSKSKIPLRPPTRGSTDSSSPEKPQKETLVDRTKRILGIKSAVSLSTEQPTRGRSRSTAETLDHTSAALQNLVELTPPSGSSTSNMSTPSIAGKTKHRNHFRPRYHRQHTGHSSSSSVLRVMLGRPPVSTPNAECMYTGSDSQQYFRVELTAPHAPTYLPSEARRIGTPPLPESKLRGFFFDYKPPHSPPQTKMQSAGPWPNEPMDTTMLQPRQHYNPKLPHTFGGQRTSGARSQTNDPDGVDWFRVKMALGQAEDERGGFELHVPEHLPSSPLCPRHPKHKTGGKGVCVYHGRNKTGPDDVVEEVEGLWR
ncbi:MAG: hypothetical protein L6R38_004766 [Xanthoria sp. 2 TBL-2021]|nr:MAG: hypothetical protein L6R38_004766 [Xanthoria sp. 2 TBL-2021]